MTLQCFTKYRFRTKFWTPYRTYQMQIESRSQSRARIRKPFPYILIQIEPQIAFRESKPSTKLFEFLSIGSQIKHYPYPTNPNTVLQWFNSQIRMKSLSRFGFGLVCFTIYSPLLVGDCMLIELIDCKLKYCEN